MEADELVAWVQEMEKQDREWWAWFEREMERDPLSTFVGEIDTHQKC